MESHSNSASNEQVVLSTLRACPDSCLLCLHTNRGVMMFTYYGVLLLRCSQRFWQTYSSWPLTLSISLLCSTAKSETFTNSQRCLSEHQQSGFLRKIGIGSVMEVAKGHVTLLLFVIWTHRRSVTGRNVGNWASAVLRPLGEMES